MVPRIHERARGRPVPHAWLTTVFVAAAWSVLSGAVAWAGDTPDTCPIPHVYVPAYGTDPWLVEISVNRVTQLNMGGVRFFSFLHPAISSRRLSGDEYRLAGVSTVDSAELHAVSLTLTDPKGRLVVAAEASGSSEGRNVLDLDRELAEQVAAALTPLRQHIRDHQRRVRDREPVAIAAIVTADPTAFTVEVGDERVVTFELKDCDGYVLSERTLIIDVHGVGRVEPTEVVTDADGAGEFTFVSDEAGEATVFIVHPHERPEGVMVLADGDTVLPVTVLGDVLVEQALGFAGVEGRGRMFSCGGLGGAWSGESSLTFSLPEVRGTLTGQGGFTFPPEPVSGERTSASWRMTGTLVLPDVGGEVEFVGEWSYEAVLSEADGVWTLAGEGGTVHGSVVANIPEVGRISIPMSLPLEHGPPATVTFTGVPECAE